ncbi:hypothetical protein [Pseudoalteromonas sp. T1lg23B]|uniref:hypothetical protein n=1 Tax=Pseudoalteromonas sp. T1lg23B TaxID=2077097 RepID=UPI000CF67C61|nr:hypothetical protein [Pseudoalteromonas sp. T1lg23B]
MRGLIGIVLFLIAFALGIMVERLWLAAPPVSIHTAAEKQSVIAPDVQTRDNPQPQPLQTTSEQPEIALQIEALNSTIAQLNEQNFELQQQLSFMRQQKDSAAVQVPNSDLNTQLSQQYQQESRDALWADDQELQINDFLYQNDLSHMVALQSYGCKSTVCQIELVPAGNIQEFDASYWREVSEKLFAQPWFKRFTISTSTSTDQRMQIFLSTQEVKD